MVLLVFVASDSNLHEAHELVENGFKFFFRDCLRDVANVKRDRRSAELVCRRLLLRLLHFY